MPKGSPDPDGNTDKTILSIRTAGGPNPNHRTLKIGRYRLWQAAVAVAQWDKVRLTYTLYLTNPLIKPVFLLNYLDLSKWEPKDIFGSHF